MKLAVCVINWNGFEDTKRCLASLARHCKEADVFLLENGSGEEERLRPCLAGRTQLFASPENLGFAGGNNLLIRKALEAGYEAIFLLNNDAEVTEGFLAEPLSLLAQPDVGFLQSKLLFAGTDRVENAGNRHLSSGDVIPEGRGRSSSACSANRGIMSGCGAALFLKGAMLRDVGLFREEFFLGYEDVDLTYRATIQGWKGLFCASSVVHHCLHSSLGRIDAGALVRRSRRNAWRAYLLNTPAAVIALDAPWIVAAQLLGTIAAIAFDRKHLAAALWSSNADIGREWPRLMRARRENLLHRRLGALTLWRRQRSFLLSIPALVRELAFRRETRRSLPPGGEGQGEGGE